MKGSTDEATRTALTLVLGIFVVYSIYLFGTEIFKAGARINVSSSLEGEQCACIGTAGYNKIECSGKLVECSPCAADGPGYCNRIQNLTIDSPSATSIKSLKVCSSTFAPGVASAGAINIYADENLLGSIIGSCGIETAACCKEFQFPEPRSIREIKGDAQIGFGVWRLEAYWQSKSTAS